MQLLVWQGYLGPLFRSRSHPFPSHFFFADAPANCRTASRRVRCQLEVCPLIAAVRPVHRDHLAPLQRYRRLTITRWVVPPDTPLYTTPLNNPLA